MTFDEVLRRLLRELDALRDFWDTITRERIANVLNWHFVFAHPADEDFPKRYAMGKPEEDAAVCAALRRFVTDVRPLVAHLPVGEERALLLDEDPVWDERGEFSCPWGELSGIGYWELEPDECFDFGEGKQLAPPPTEGDLIVVPLPNGQWGAGIVARYAEGPWAVCLFFRTAYDSAPSVEQLVRFSNADVVLQRRVFTEAFTTPIWTVVGRMPDWNRSDWPVSLTFSNFDDRMDADWPWQIYTYSDDDLSHVTADVTREEAAAHPPQAFSLAAGDAHALMLALGIEPPAEPEPTDEVYLVFEVGDESDPDGLSGELADAGWEACRWDSEPAELLRFRKAVHEPLTHSELVALRRWAKRVAWRHQACVSGDPFDLPRGPGA